jgi:hypothetical protein
MPLLHLSVILNHHTNWTIGQSRAEKRKEEDEEKKKDLNAI